MNKRIFVCGLLQESNSFNPVLSTFEDFVGAGIYEGESLVSAGAKAGATRLALERLNGRMLKMARTSVSMMAPAHGYSTARCGLKTLIRNTVTPAPSAPH